VKVTMDTMIVEATYENGLLKPTDPLPLKKRENVWMAILNSPEAPTPHPYVVRSSKAHSGRPFIRGTRVLVQTIVGYYKLGMTADEILSELPHLTAAQVFDALSYYHDHQTEIEADIAAEKPETLLPRHGLQRQSSGRVVPTE
jgi:uncharacterized protein (DUF433 family)